MSILASNDPCMALTQDQSLSSWQCLMVLPEPYRQQVIELYQGNIRLDVREALTDWIDQRDWEVLDARSSTLEAVPGIASSFLKALQDVSVFAWDPNVSASLQEAYLSYTDTYGSVPIKLIYELRECILKERLIRNSYAEILDQTRLEPAVDQALGVAGILRHSLNEAYSLAQQIIELKLVLSKLASEWRSFQEGQLAWQQQYARMQASNPSAEIDLSIQSELEKKHNDIGFRAQSAHEEKSNFLSRLEKSVAVLEGLKKRIIDERLTEWKRRQRILGFCEPFSQENLDIVQTWSASLVENIWVHREIAAKLWVLTTELPHAANAAMKSVFSTLQDRINTLASEAMRKLFVVSRQPPQVIGVSSPVSTQVQFLVGDKLNLSGSPLEVTVHFVNNVEAISAGESGVLTNSRSCMKYDPERRTLVASFPGLSLKKLKREARGAQVDTEGQFYFLYKLTLKLGGITHVLRALSLPVLVINRREQVSKALGTVLWHNAFSDPERKLFTMPHEVLWRQLARVLSTGFCEVTSTGISGDDLRFLARELLQDPDLGCDFADRPLSWAQFCGEPLPSREFSFWEWVHAIMTLCRDHLKELWMKRAVWGFISQKEAEEILSWEPSGTFILKFCEYTLGGLSVVWIDAERQVQMTRAFSAEDFPDRGLAAWICDVEEFKFVYPGTPKERIFSCDPPPPELEPISEAEESTAEGTGSHKPSCLNAYDPFQPLCDRQAAGENEPELLSI